MHRIRLRGPGDANATSRLASPPANNGTYIPAGSMPVSDILALAERKVDRAGMPHTHTRREAPVESTKVAFTEHATCKDFSNLRAFGSATLLSEGAL